VKIFEFEMRRPVHHRIDSRRGTFILRVVHAFNAEMTNMPYLTIFMRGSHISFRSQDRDYLVREKYRFRRLSPSATATRGVSLDIKLLLRPLKIKRGD